MEAKLEFLEWGLKIEERRLIGRNGSFGRFPNQLSLKGLKLIEAISEVKAEDSKEKAPAGGGG